MPRANLLFDSLESPGRDDLEARVRSKARAGECRAKAATPPFAAAIDAMRCDAMRCAWLPISSDPAPM
eukprot:gene17284-biopygen10234